MAQDQRATQEILFARTLAQVRALAGMQHNRISREQAEEAFESLSLSQEQLLLVFDYLQKHNIRIGQESEEGQEEDPQDQEPLEADCLEEYRRSVLTDEFLSDGEREAVILSAMAGEKQAQHRLIGLFLPRVAEVARLYTGQGVLPEDLIGEGNLALSVGVTMLGCLENADEAEGMLMKMVMDAMEDAVSQSFHDRERDQKVVNRVNQVAEKAGELSGELHRKVTVSELSKETGISRKVIEDAMRMSGFKIEGLQLEDPQEQRSL